MKKKSNPVNSKEPTTPRTSWFFNLFRHRPANTDKPEVVEEIKEEEKHSNSPATSKRLKRKHKKAKKKEEIDQEIADEIKKNTRTLVIETKDQTETKEWAEAFREDDIDDDIFVEGILEKVPLDTKMKDGRTAFDRLLDFDDLDFFKDTMFKIYLAGKYDNLDFLSVAIEKSKMTHVKMMLIIGFESEALKASPYKEWKDYLKLHMDIENFLGSFIEKTASYFKHVETRYGEDKELVMELKDSFDPMAFFKNKDLKPLGQFLKDAANELNRGLKTNIKTKLVMNGIWVDTVEKIVIKSIMLTEQKNRDLLPTFTDFINVKEALKLPSLLGGIWHMIKSLFKKQPEVLPKIDPASQKIIRDCLINCNNKAEYETIKPLAKQAGIDDKMLDKLFNFYQQINKNHGNLKEVFKQPLFRKKQEALNIIAFVTCNGSDITDYKDFKLSLKSEEQTLLEKLTPKIIIEENAKKIFALIQDADTRVEEKELIEEISSHKMIAGLFKDEDGANILHHVAKYGNPNLFQRLKDRYPDLETQADNKGNLPDNVFAATVTKNQKIWLGLYEEIDNLAALANEDIHKFNSQLSDFKWKLKDKDTSLIASRYTTSGSRPKTLLEKAGLTANPEIFEAVKGAITEDLKNYLKKDDTELDDFLAEKQSPSTMVRNAKAVKFKLEAPAHIFGAL